MEFKDIIEVDDFLSESFDKVEDLSFEEKLDIHNI